MVIYVMNQVLTPLVTINVLSVIIVFKVRKWRKNVQQAIIEINLVHEASLIARSANLAIIATRAKTR